MQKVFEGYTQLLTKPQTGASYNSAPHTLTINIAQCLFSCKTTYGYKFVYANCTINVYTKDHCCRVITCAPYAQITN